ncbi:DNA-binding response regulator [Paenibacillus sp. 598K]|uniref:response regulator transcription factor n=1 Tax=Paenibacillus sp. 598K TaxID=1117987 RepID=UPI000FF9A045|nr:response regulator transcription factor [Paenibacillus sp. 598K]GBF74233.1 DNA-binding response regulator [Paenibacillus sp. 598K]
MYNIFIVEDDPQLALLLGEHLGRFGHRIGRVHSWEHVGEECLAFDPHLVLMDVNLPRYDGYYWCRQIRRSSTCPILFLSAREGKMDQVMALENGADDYITKPFDYELVTAKVGSLLRRAYGSYAAGSDRTTTVAGLTLDCERLQLSLRDRRIELSHTESQILDELLRRPEQLVSRDRLLERIWDEHAFVDDNTLNVYVNRVRKKLAQLEIDGAIQTVRGAGYRLLPVWESRG